MLGPHILGCCFVTLLHMAMMALQSASCPGLALDARYAATLARVGLVLVSAIGPAVRYGSPSSGTIAHMIAYTRMPGNAAETMEPTT